MLETPTGRRYSAMTSENLANRDNQQITVLQSLYRNGTPFAPIQLGYPMITEAEAAWLAGFLDADGMIRLRIGRKNKVKHGGVGPKSLVPIVAYCGTCVFTMKRLAELLSKAFADGYAATVSGASNFQLHVGEREEKKWAAKWDIEVGGITRAMPLLQLLRPHLITKGTEADLALMFCSIRLEKGRQPYGSLEYHIFEALKFLKTTRHLRDYMPSTEQVLSEDIVRSNAEALEAAEMTARLPIEARREWARNLVADYRWNKAGHGK